MQQATVRVPASTSNLGPGFDCLGVALAIHNHVTVSRGRGERLPAMASAAGNAFFKRTGARPFSFSCKIGGESSPSRGLCSHASILVGVNHWLYAAADRETQPPLSFWLQP